MSEQSQGLAVGGESSWVLFGRAFGQQGTATPHGCDLQVKQCGFSIGVQVLGESVD